MYSKPSWTYAIGYCVASGLIGAVVGAIAGVGIAGMVMQPEEAVVLTAGVGYGLPVGALTGTLLGAVAMVRRTQMRTSAGKNK